MSAAQAEALEPLFEEGTRKALRFEGHSDDTFGYADNGRPCDDYDNCASGEPIRWSITCVGPGDTLVGMMVIGQYGPVGSSTWMIGVAGLADADGAELTWPDDWPIRFDAPMTPDEHSPSLTVTVPVEAEVTCLELTDEEEDDE